MRNLAISSKKTNVAKAIIEKALLASKARKAAQKARELTRRAYLREEACLTTVAI